MHAVPRPMFSKISVGILSQRTSPPTTYLKHSRVSNPQKKTHWCCSFHTHMAIQTDIHIDYVVNSTSKIRENEWLRKQTHLVPQAHHIKTQSPLHSQTSARTMVSVSWAAAASVSSCTLRHCLLLCRRGSNLIPPRVWQETDVLSNGRGGRRPALIRQVDIYITSGFRSLEIVPSVVWRGVAWKLTVLLREGTPEATPNSKIFHHRVSVGIAGGIAVRLYISVSRAHLSRFLNTSLVYLEDIWMELCQRCNAQYIIQGMWGWSGCHRWNYHSPAK